MKFTFFKTHRFYFIFLFVLTTIIAQENNNITPQPYYRSKQVLKNNKPWFGSVTADANGNLVPVPMNPHPSYRTPHVENMNNWQGSVTMDANGNLVPYLSDSDLKKFYQGDSYKNLESYQRERSGHSNYRHHSTSPDTLIAQNFIKQDAEFEYVRQCGNNHISNHIKRPLHQKYKTPLFQKAYQFLNKYCANCHSPSGEKSGGNGLDDIFDLTAMIGRNFLVPGNAKESTLVQMIEDGDMPLEFPNSETFVNPEDFENFKKWINTELNQSDFNKANFVFATDNINLSTQIECMNEFISKHPDNTKNLRFLTLTHLYNAGSFDALKINTKALSKSLNSLSWNPKLVRLIPIDPNETIFAIYLNHLNNESLAKLYWNEQTWSLFSGKAHYPYWVGAFSEDSLKLRSKLSQLTYSKDPYIRADWFMSVATVPPMYHKILGLNDQKGSYSTQAQLKDFLNTSGRYGNFIRAGFPSPDSPGGSGVSFFNRIIERQLIHRYLDDQGNPPAYWESYDFAGKGIRPNLGTASIKRQNIFENPTSQATGDPFFYDNLGFNHDGGEIIFNLPNGQQAYLLVTSNGKRLDTAPTNIVKDKNGNTAVRTYLQALSIYKNFSKPSDNPGNKTPIAQSSAVVNSLSCMGCHFSGIIKKKDMIADHFSKVESNSNSNRSFLSYLNQKYTLNLQSSEYLVDRDRFKRSLEKINLTPVKDEPVHRSMKRLFKAINDKELAAEIGIEFNVYKELLKHVDNNLKLSLRLNHSPKDNTPLIDREILQDNFQSLLQQMGLVPGLLSQVRGTTNKPTYTSRHFK